MTDWILNGWGNKDLWVLNNSAWEAWHEEDTLKTGNGISGGYGEREFADIENKDWKFEITGYTESTPQMPRGIDMQFFLNGDPNPIIFRINFDDPEDSYWTFYIIYEGNIKDSKTFYINEVPPSDIIYRIGSTYYFTSSKLSFNYGSVKKPIKLRLATCEKNYNTHWYNLRWWYSEVEQDYAFIM